MRTTPPAVRVRRLRALLIPADPSRPLALLPVADTAAAISDAIGGGLIDDTITGTHGGHGFTLYLGEDTVPVPDNPRAAVLAARLGLHERAIQARLRGDVLIAGLGAGSDHDLPDPVLQAVAACGVLGVPQPRRH